LEAEVAREIGDKEKLVVATGGGMMLSPANARSLTASGRVFCLVASPEEIFRRASGDTTGKRPLLEGPDPIARITALLRERQPSYAQFAQVQTAGKTAAEVVEELLAALSRPQGPGP
jgi:shikimate kinase